jgi:hypothetical protein
MRYLGPTYYGHPYLDGRGFFLDGHPLDDSAAQCSAEDLTSSSDPLRDKQPYPPYPKSALPKKGA